MVTQQEAEALAQKHVQDYLNACGLDTAEDAGNALMKLCGVAGVMMCATLAKKLRDEAAGKIAEAQRVEDGIAADKKELDDMLAAAMNKPPN